MFILCLPNDNIDVVDCGERKQLLGTDIRTFSFLFHLVIFLIKVRINTILFLYPLFAMFTQSLHEDLLSISQKKKAI